MNINQGDYVGVPDADGKIGCPVRRVSKVTEDGFTLIVPGIGVSRLYEDDGTWEKVAGREMSEAEGCGCDRCTNGLLGLALLSE